MKDALTYANEAGFFSFNVVGWKAEFERLIEAVRADALAELATVNESLTAQDHFADTGNKVLDHIADTGKIVAEPVQEPVAKVVLREQRVGFGREEERKDIKFLSDVEVGTKLYAALVERQWVDLTDGEIEEAFKSASKIMKPWEPVKAVIAAFKDKNK